MSLNPGDLNRRIEIMRSTEADDGKGGYATSWSAIATVWAKATGQAGREAVIAQALQGITVYRFRIRYRSDLTDADQIRFEGEDFNIASMWDPDDGAREALDVLATTENARATT